MADAVQFLKLIKTAAVEAVDATKPVNVFYGTVLSTNPLSIEVEQKMQLGVSQLILSKSVTNYKTSADWGEGKRAVTIYNSLVVGNKVILIREFGGQKYIVLDRVET